MADLVIRGARVVDGTGRAAFDADVAIEGDRIREVGRVSARGTREIDAGGRLLTPGWVDIHTHYDGQATWDSQLAPSSLHGVTSVVMGNCGVGFAPARSGAAEHDFLIALMEGVEDIPGTALHEGLAWNWESLPEFFDAIARRPHAIDLGAQVPHAALRAYVMGERGGDHAELPTADEIGQMAEITREALMAGAMGFATSRTQNHRSRTGKRIGSLTATSDEILGIAGGLKAAGRGVLQFVSDFGDLDAELGLMKAAAQLSGRPVSVSLAQADQAPERWREVIAWLERATASGVDMKAQTPARAIGLFVGLEGSMNPWARCASYRAIGALPIAERAKRMHDGELRARILAEAATAPAGPLGLGANAVGRLFRLGDPPDYEPAPEKALGVEAGKRGMTALELVYDTLLERDGRELLYLPFLNYSGGTLDAAREMLLSDRTLPGLSDGGAHVSFICDASFPTFLLTHWCRDRSRGEKLPLEFVVRRQTRDTARHVGWLDRGVIAPGYLADLNVIDFDALSLRAPTMIRDLPAGGMRLMQLADGYDYTVKRGVVTFEGGVSTGALPGELVRGAQPLAS